MKISFAIACALFMLQTASVTNASIIDAPHNETNNITCGTCHNYSLWWQFSPIDADPSDLVLKSESLCLKCHDGFYPDIVKVINHASASLGSMHRTALGDFTNACVDCHDPHFQAQLNWHQTVPDTDLYLVTGTMLAGTVVTSGQGTIASPYSTTFEYQDIFVNHPDWGNETTPWDAKTGNSGRGLLLALSASAPENTYEITNVDEVSHEITVSGKIDPAFNDSGANFGLIYGQLIRDFIEVESAYKDVKFFDNKGGFADAATYEGICQICHTKTRNFRNADGINFDDYTFDHTGKDEENCINCHSHSNGMVHAGGTGTGCGSATECHGTQDSHPAHVDPSGILGADCSRCHDTSNFPSFKTDKTILCGECHDDGTGTKTTVPDWGTSVAQCTECHAAVPATGSHRKHLATAGISCHNCHADTVQGSTPPSQHLDGDIDVYSETVGDLGYPVDKPKGSAYGSCTNASCHGAGAPTWGQTVSCADCHLGPNDIDDYSYANEIMATISAGEWEYAGHGKAAETYDVSENPAAALTAAANGGNPCLYCHDGSVGHGAGENPFRLANLNLLGNGPNDNCLTCHGTAGPGYDPDNEGAMLAKTATVKIDMNHFGYKHDVGNDGGSLCWDCHDPHGDRVSDAGNIFMIHTNVTAEKVDDYGTPATIASPAFTNNATAADYAADNAPFTGICQVCHTATNYYKNNSGANGHFTDLPCLNCHQHGSGTVDIYAFNHGGGSGDAATCQECHGHDAAYDGLTGGKGTYQTHSTHTENDTDDARGPYIGCDGCHNTSSMPDFNDGTTYSDYKLGAATTVCNSCHSEQGSYDGVNDPELGARANWQAGIYESSGALKPGKDKWCATCHDEVPSVINGISAPNVIGAESGDYTYGSGWGYYKTGHGLDSKSTYPASGGLVYGAGKSCDNCHDYLSAHIDGDARTYNTPSDNYQAGYRLKSIDGGEPMNIPLPQNIDTHNADHYRLCLSCHDPNTYLQTAPDLVTTSFRDDLDLGPWDGGDAPINIHEYHLSRNNLSYDSDWLGGGDSLISCPNCHNVHGSTQLAMVRDGKLVGREPGLVVFYDGILTPPTVSSATVPNTQTTLAESTGTLFAATTGDNLCADCHGGLYVKWYRSPPAAPAAPILTWTGENNYTADGVNPDSGTKGDYFTFRINYTDANQQRPTAIQVWVDEDANGTYEDDEKYNLTEADADDVDVTDGKLYRKILLLNSAGSTTINYRFYATDGPFDAVGDPTNDSDNFITITNSAPSLVWTGEEGYISDGVNPNIAAAGSTFAFKIIYIDADNDAPAFVDLKVDLNDDGDYEDSGEQLGMTPVDADDADYTDGKLYTQEIFVTAAGDNQINYTFSASDAEMATGTPTTEQTFSLTTNNHAPILSWTNEDDYTRDGVSPDADVAGNLFSFRVNYLDLDNDPPAMIQTWVDINDDGDYDDLGEKIDMIEVDSDSDYSDGKLYATALPLAVAGDGIIDYRFYSADGIEEAVGNPTENNFLTILIDALMVSCEGSGSYDYTSLQTAIDALPDHGTIIVADGVCNEAIVIDNKDLTIKSLHGAGSTTINANGALTAVTFQNGAASTLKGFTITGGNNTNGYGAGVKIDSSSPTISASIITGNYAQKASAIYVTGSLANLNLEGSTINNNSSSYQAPGIYLASGTSAKITGSTISDNTASSSSNGGGIWMNSSSDASLLVSDSTITNNSVNLSGGGLYVLGSGGKVSVTINNTIISNHSGLGSGGGMYVIDQGADFSLSITGSTINGNSTTYNGAGLYLANLDTVIINGSTISNNAGKGEGGGMFATGIGSLSFSDSTIMANTTASAVGGGFRLSNCPNTIFSRCLITGNTAGTGGGGGYISGVLAAPSATTFVNCQVTGNKAGGSGGGLFLADDAYSSNITTVTNSTFSGNKAGGSGGGIYNWTTTSVLNITNSIFWKNSGTTYNELDGSGIITASYSDIRQFGFEGNNNFNIDPLFVDEVSHTAAPTSAGDYHLQLSSPVIDAGTAIDSPVDDIDNNVRPLGDGIEMGADEVVTISNSVPSLSWTMETNYTAGGVNQAVGPDGGSFDFRIKYADADNDPASSIQAWIDKNDDGDYLDAGEKFDMHAVDSDDIDVTDGKLYFLTETISYAGDGILNYRFYANDAISGAAGLPTTAQTLIINTAPTLAWLGSGSYTADGVEPDSGKSNTSFKFRINYIDANNDKPTAIQVWVDKNDDGDYLDSGEKTTLTEVDSNDTEFSDGKEYSTAMTLNYVGDGIIDYRFYASDGSIAAGNPTSPLTLAISNSAPTLSWLGVDSYLNDGVNPNGGTSGANSFEFQITYTDIDNEAPSSIEVWIDLNDDGFYLDPEERILMSEVDGDVDFRDGKIYAYTATNLTRMSDDTLIYRFAASDGTLAATGTPTSEDNTLQVSTANNVPKLDWTNEINYSADGVEPDSGMAGFDFTFRVQYTDLENVAPASIELWVDLNDDLLEDGDELITMTAVDFSDTTYDDGKLYTATVVIPAQDDQKATYHFKASDGIDAAIGNATADLTVNIMTPFTVCALNHRDAPCNFTSIQTAINNVNVGDGDYILVKDGIYNSAINYNGKNLYIVSESGAAATTLANNGTGYSFDNPVVKFSNGETAKAVLDGFTITNQNSGYGNARGIYISEAAPTIKNCIIENNAPANGTDGGGGVYIINASPSFDNCTIRANSYGNRSGCGIYIKGANGGATIANSTFGGPTSADGNKCTNGRGGAIYYTGATSGKLVIKDTTFENNQSTEDGGSLYLLNNSNPTEIKNCSIINNHTQITTTGHGGGIYANNSPLQLSQCTVSGNEAGGSRNGGGIYSVNSSLTIAESIINANKTGLSNYGGGGAIYFNGTTFDMTKSYVQGNTSTSYGGGLRLDGGSTTITNSIIAGNNVSKNNNSPGGGIANFGTLNLYFSTLADNYADGGGGLYANGTENIYNSIIWGNACRLELTEILGEPEVIYLSESGGDPSFIRRSTADMYTPTIDGDYHLSSTSNCIDTADDTHKPASDDDIEGTIRPFDISGKGDGVDDYDKGAYEYRN